MNKSKFLNLIIVGLVIFNGILLFYCINKSIPPGGPKNYIIDKLHFDKEQIEKYDGYIQLHRKAVRDNEATMKDLRNELYKQLKYEQDTIKIDSLISVIAKQQTKAEWINYNHFVEIKKLCKPSQLEDFEELTDEISKLFSKK